MKTTTLREDIGMLLHLSVTGEEQYEFAAELTNEVMLLIDERARSAEHPLQQLLHDAKHGEPLTPSQRRLIKATRDRLKLMTRDTP